MGQQIPTEGRIVHYQLGPEKVRPAIIVNAWGAKTPDARVNLMIFTDGSNDDTDLEVRERSTPPSDQGANGKCADRVVWRTSVAYSEAGDIGSWRWPAYVPAVATEAPPAPAPT